MNEALSAGEAPRITVIGTGYLGAVHAACMAELGYEVLGLDTDMARLQALQAGKAPFYEPGLDELLVRVTETGRLRFTTSIAEAAEFGDIHFICVGTPQAPGTHAADLRHVDAAVTSLAPLLRDGALVVGKSTVPVGTAARLAELLRSISPHGDGVSLCWNPEFLREGYAVADTLRPDRLVVGVSSERDEMRLRALYAPIIETGTPFLSMDFATAELTKAAANAFLATKISFINAMADVCDAAGADVLKLAEAIGHDDRIGKRFLHAGLGFGGGCLPKDIRALMARAGELGVGESLAFLSAVDQVNMQRRQRTIDAVKNAAGGTLLSRTVACLGASFKPDSDDVRDSPALNVAASMQLQGAAVRVHDPVAMDNARRQFPTLDYVNSIKAAVVDADVVVLLTEWEQFVEMDPADLEPLVRSRQIVDARNALDPGRWRAAGWSYTGLGRR